MHYRQWPLSHHLLFKKRRRKERAMIPCQQPAVTPGQRAAAKD
jgi:hypothetical protein